MPKTGPYQKIVVPLDGSGWSERAISHAVDIARNNDSELILLHVYKPPAHEFTGEIALAGQESQLDQKREEAKQHFVAVRNQLRGEKVNVRCQMIEGLGVAHLICDFINDQDIDLVVLSTHGRTGLARFLFGSVAQKVLQEVKIPVLLVRPDRDQ